MMKKIFLLIAVINISLSSNSQTLAELLQQKKEGYKITGTVNGLKDSTVMLAYYFGGKQYATDTANVVNGKFIFEGDKKLKGGMYLVVLS